MAARDLVAIDNELRALRAALKAALDASRSATATVSGVAS